MRPTTVLISGGGIAGSTLAYWLGRHGFRVAVVERAGALRSSGNPVDIRGPAISVVEQMGILPALRAAATKVSSLSFLDGAGRRAGRINLRAMRRAAGNRELEIPRGDLAAILHTASANSGEVLFGDSIAALTPDGDGVSVAFERGGERRFDLVIGADGLHSNVRQLVFGPESAFVNHAGLYVATVGLEGEAENEHEVQLFNRPGRLISVHPSRGRTLAAFIFRSPEIAGLDYRDTAQHKRVLRERFRDVGWRAAELLARVDAANDLYFDSVSEVRLASWSRGRVSLVGDAASCVSLLGDGSSLAIAGAFTLANALRAAASDYRAAFGRYEATHRILVEPKQRGVARGASILVPATQAGIAARNLATRLWPLGAAAAWVRTALARDARPALAAS
jgi:2-polyprenyl-6-methoxyphenol hydroxylase and related FAD-dependent oxidoreductases